ncbi:MAG: prolyl oligopeptidase family serine peptidase [Herpetosiphonaceae bacterium]|nr:prolyl oligopeptidase family serine peptidase [Herpetosiphonaceae bacterium]
MLKSLRYLLLLPILAACGQAAQPQPDLQPATATPALAAMTTPIPPTITPAPTSTAPPAATPIPETPTPDPVAGLTIPDLRARPVGAGEITVGAIWNQAAGYTSYRISYPADGLTLTGLLHVPAGDGPFPVIIANRGTIARDIYQPGMDSRAFSDLMARNGFLVVAPDFRGYAGGDDGPNQFYTGYYMDVIGLIPLAQKLPLARPGKVGMWGHSRGGSATIAALTVSDQIAAAVVYAPAPADLAQDYARRFRQSGGNPGGGTWPFPPDANLEAYRRVSPITYFAAISAPVQLHHGTADSTVDESASVAMAETLRALGKEVTLHLYEGGGHALQGDAYNLYAERTLEFFRRHLVQ